jgi:predicted ATPase
VPRREPEDTEVIGRDAELVIADAALERLQAGVGGLLLVEGEAGIGKSALLDTIGARARQRGLTVVAVAAEPHESAQSLALAHRLLHGIAVERARPDTRALGRTEPSC